MTMSNGSFEGLIAGVGRWPSCEYLLDPDLAVAAPCDAAAFADPSADCPAAAAAAAAAAAECPNVVFDHHQTIRT